MRVEQWERRKYLKEKKKKRDDVGFTWFILVVAVVVFSIGLVN